MRTGRFGSRPRAAFVGVVAAGYGLMLSLNLPGHLSVDSILALYEGRFGVRETWGPAFYAWLLGALDGLVPGTGLYVCLSGLLLFGAWALMARLPARVSWLAPLAAALAILAPNVVVYQGIVWKDVLFANLAVAGFVVLAFAMRDWPRRRLGLLALAAVLLAAGALVRQNGLLVWIPAAAAVAWAAWPEGLRRAAGWGLGWLAVTASVFQLLSVTALPQGPGAVDTAGSKGVRIVQHYDLAGAVARDPDHPLPEIDQADPAADDYLRAAAGRVYSPERVDTLGQDPGLGAVLWSLPDEAVRAEWLDLILERPAVYLDARWDAFTWVFATPVIDRCLPAHVGVDGPSAQMAKLGLAPRRTDEDRRLYNYVTWYLDTPVMSHLPYALAALLAGGLLLLRRERGDVAMAALMVAAMGFTASFFVISIACDYRYLYFLDLAAITGVLYLALDPRLRRRI